MRNDAKGQAPKKVLGEVNRNLMERDKAWDVTLQRSADEWNVEEENES